MLTHLPQKLMTWTISLFHRRWVAHKGRAPDTGRLGVKANCTDPKAGPRIQAGWESRQIVLIRRPGPGYRLAGSRDKLYWSEGRAPDTGRLGVETNCTDPKAGPWIQAGWESRQIVLIRRPGPGYRPVWSRDKLYWSDVLQYAIIWLTISALYCIWLPADWTKTQSNVFLIGCSNNNFCFYYTSTKARNVTTMTMLTQSVHTGC